MIFIVFPCVEGGGSCSSLGGVRRDAVLEVVAHGLVLGGPDLEPRALLLAIRPVGRLDVAAEDRNEVLPAGDEVDGAEALTRAVGDLDHEKCPSPDIRRGGCDEMVRIGGIGRSRTRPSS